MVKHLKSPLVKTNLRDVYTMTANIGLKLWFWCQRWVGLMLNRMVVSCHGDDLASVVLVVMKFSSSFCYYNPISSCSFFSSSCYVPVFNISSPIAGFSLCLVIKQFSNVLIPSSKSFFSIMSVLPPEYTSNSGMQASRQPLRLWRQTSVHMQIY